MYAWEKPFAKIVSMARGREIRAIRYASWIRGILLSFIMFSSRVSIFTSLVMFALLGYNLTAQQAFAVTAYYNVLRQTMTVFFPQAIGFLAETIVSVNRLEKFMLYEELDRDFQNAPKKSDDEKPHENGQSKVEPKILQDPGINMEKVCAKWRGESNDLTLTNVNLRVQPTTVVAIIGKVGSGKSSLLQSILGELPVDSGKIHVNGKISFASQEPWLFSSSVRQNILFGLPMDKTRYRAVIKACSLTRDFELWPDGDKTIVGERGMSLSGGQKARINLARSVYRVADIYLLDDQLSAVDSHVQRHLFDHCIKEFLKDKIVIFVTHQLQYLPNVDQIVLLDGGQVQAVGSYESLRDTGLDFTKLLPQEEAGQATEGLTDDIKSPQKQFSRSTSKSSKDSRTAYKRHDSVSSMTSRASAETDISIDPEQVDEKSAGGSIGWKFYNAYIKGIGGYPIALFIAFMFVAAQIFASAGDYFLTYWVSKEEERNTVQQVLPVNETLKMAAHPNDTFVGAVQHIWEGVMYDRNIDIYIFSALTIGCVAITLSRSFMFFNVAMKASRRLHDAMFSGITHATMYFFNTNPSGRILNRFSKDIGQIDEILPMTIVDVLQIFLSLFGIIVVVAIVNPYTLIPTVIIAILFYFMRSFYLKSSRNIKRMDATSE
jgi:ATP-binding cassette subfamily C (CFTR/MRP) protein 4